MGLFKTFIYPWIDLLWLPLAWVSVHRAQRWLAMAFVLGCIGTLRLQYELLVSIGYGRGLLGWLPLNPFSRGLIAYGLFITVFLILSHYSPRTGGVIYMGAALSMYIFAFAASMALMAL